MSTIRNPKQLLGLLRMATSLSLAASASSHAQLGTTVDDAPTSASAVIHQAWNGAFDYRETTDANGIVVRQYVDASGKVFAVTWRGPAMADIQALLGTYFQRFRDGATASAGEAGLHAARVSDGDLVVENQVRLREFSGRAWLAKALPPGVAATDIQ